MSQTPATFQAPVALALALAKARAEVSPGSVQGLLALAASMAQDGAARDDPMREIFARLGDKWSMLLLLVLRTGAFRHALLRRLVDALADGEAISQRVLTLRLRSLERDGLLRRAVTPTVPPQVEYALTDLGADLLVQIDALMAWVRRHNSDIRDARKAFERAQIG